MAQWIPNPIYGDPNGGDFIDDLGTVHPDPEGRLREQAPPAMSSTPAAVAAFTAPPPAAPPPGEHLPPVPADQRRAADLTAALEAPDPAKVRGSADAVAATPVVPGGPPDPARSFAAYQQSTSSSTSKTSGETGLSDEAQQRQGANISAAAGASADAAQAQREAQTLDVLAQQDLMAQERERAANAARKAQAELDVKTRIAGDTERRLQALQFDADGNPWRPNRQELFQGDRGAAFGILGAISVIAGAWMQGRGMTNRNQFLDSIMSMIDENVKDQVRSHSEAVQALKERGGSLTAGIAALKQEQLRYVERELQAKAALAKTPAAQAQVEATFKSIQAQNAKWEQEKRQALERQSTHSVTQTFQRTQAPMDGAGVGAKPAERNEQQGKAQAAQDTINAFGEAAGLQRDANGRWVTGKGPLPPALIERWNPFSDDEIQAKAEAAVEAYGRMQSGGVIGEKEREAFKEQLGSSTRTRDQLAQRLNAAENAIRARLRSSDEQRQQQTTTIPRSWGPR